MAKKTEVLQIRLTKEEKDFIKRIADKNRMDMSEFLLYGAMRVVAESEFINQRITENKEVY